MSIGPFQSLQGQTTSRQAAVDTLRKTADALIAAEGDLLSNPEEIQETVGESTSQACRNMSGLSHQKPILASRRMFFHDNKAQSPHLRVCFISLSILFFNPHK